MHPHHSQRQRQSQSQRPESRKKKKKKKVKHMINHNSHIAYHPFDYLVIFHRVNINIIVIVIIILAKLHTILGTNVPAIALCALTDVFCEA